MDDQIKNELEKRPYPVENVIKAEETIENTFVDEKNSENANEENGRDGLKKSPRNRRKHRYNRKNDPECFKSVENGKSEETNHLTFTNTTFTNGNNNRMCEERKDKDQIDREKNRKNQNGKGGRNNERKEYYGKKYSALNH